MIIDITNMYNYQIICNGENLVGVLHSYTISIIKKQLKRKTLFLDKKFKNGTIINAQVVEDE